MPNSTIDDIRPSEGTSALDATARAVRTLLVDAAGAAVDSDAVADGADVALGATTDAAATSPSAAASVIALLKGLFTRVSLAAGTAVIGHVIPDPPLEWALTMVGGSNIRATVTMPAGTATQRHVCTGLVAELTNDGGSNHTGTWELRSGGTILMAGRLQALATVATTGLARGDRLVMTGLHVVGSLGVEMSLSFISAPGANNYAGVTLIGYTTE